MKSDNEKLKNKHILHRDFFFFATHHGIEQSFCLSFCGNRGYAALTTTLFTVGISLIILGGLSFFALQEVTINRNFIKSVEAENAAESGIEDMVFRVVSGKQTSAQETLGLGKATTTITITSAGSEKTIRSEGKQGAYQKNLETKLTVDAEGVSFFYGIQVGSGGLTMGNNAVINGNVYSNGNIIGGNGVIITGDAVAAGAGNRIEGVTIGNSTLGSGRASSFVNTTIHGSFCPNAYCIVENPPQINLPIPAETIQEWKDAGSEGGICVPPQCDSSGNYKLTGGASGSLGPKRITGNLELDNNAILTVLGTIFVEGNIVLSNNCTIRLDSGYGSLSGTIITNGTISISNNCIFQGSGNENSYIMLLSDKNALSSEVITVDNNSDSVILYASQGRIKFSNGSIAKEATGYGITLDNNAEIFYESGLTNLNFSSGSGGGYSIQSWKEVE